MINIGIKYGDSESLVNLDQEYIVKGQLLNYAFEAKCILNKVNIKIDVGHWGGNYGGETIPIGNTHRLSQYLSKEALEDVKKYAERLSASEQSWHWDIPHIENGVRKFIQLTLNKNALEVFFEVKFFEFNTALQFICIDKFTIEDFAIYVKNNTEYFFWLFPELINEINESLQAFEKDELQLSVENKQSYFFSKDNNCLAWIFNIDKPTVQEIRWSKGKLNTIQWSEIHLPIKLEEHQHVLDFAYLLDLEVIKKRLGREFVDFYGSMGEPKKEINQPLQHVVIKNQDEIDARIDLVMQHLKRVPHESSLNVFKQIGEKVALVSPFIELTFDNASWKIGNNLLTFAEKEVQPFSDYVLTNLTQIKEMYVMKSSLLIEIELNKSKVLVQLDKFTGEILAVKLT